MDYKLTTHNGPAAQLATARDKFATVVKDPSPLTSETWKNWRASKSCGRELLLDGHQLPITGKTIELTAWEVGFALSDEELASLRALQSRMEAMHVELSKYGASNVVPERLRQSAAIDAAANAGQPIGDLTVMSTESIRTDFSHKAATLRRMLSKVTTEEVMPLCHPILERFAQSLETHMAGMEAGDREWCEAYDIPFTPSIHFKVVAAVAQRYATRRTLHESSWATPKHLLGDLVEI